MGEGANLRRFSGSDTLRGLLLVLLDKDEDGESDEDEGGAEDDAAEQKGVSNGEDESQERMGKKNCNVQDIAETVEVARSIGGFEEVSCTSTKLCQNPL
jgi:hypothetical protein